MLLFFNSCIRMIMGNTCVGLVRMLPPKPRPICHLFLVGTRENLDDSIEKSE